MYELTGIDGEGKRVHIAMADNETEAAMIEREERGNYGDIQRVRIG